MDLVDALLFALLAAGDMLLLIHLRQRRNRRQRLDRMSRCLAEAVRRELGKPAPRKVRPRPAPSPVVLATDVLATE